jgi:hypothetical protein
VCNTALVDSLNSVLQVNCLLPQKIQPDIIGTLFECRYERRA